MKASNNKFLSIIFSVIGLCCIVLLCSCNNNTIINKNIELPENGWTREEFVPFRFVIDDTSSSYRLYFSMRHSDDYLFMNAFFLLYTTFPNQEVKIDTIECILADYTGKWIGSGIGKYKNVQFMVKSNLSFPQQGEYVIRVKQALRIDTIRDISNIGIKILSN